MSIMKRMTCPHCLSQLDDLLDGRLDAGARQAVERHLAQCAHCRAEHRARQALLDTLRRMAVTEAPAGFEQRVLDRVLRPAPGLRLVASQSEAPAPHCAPARRSGRRWRRLSTGIAAGFAALAALLLLQPATVPDPASLAGGEVQSVRVLFNSPSAMRDVRIELHLPPGVRLASHAAGERVLSWHTDLDAGPNLLELPIVIEGERNGAPLTTRLFHEGRQRDFVVPMPEAVRGVAAPADAAALAAAPAERLGHA